MTQKYYTENVLPYYLQGIAELKSRGLPAILVEDGDPSHRHRSEANLPANLRRSRFVQMHWHTAQSPDLNLIEGV